MWHRSLDLAFLFQHITGACSAVFALIFFFDTLRSASLDLNGTTTNTSRHSYRFQLAKSLVHTFACSALTRV